MSFHTPKHVHKGRLNFISDFCNAVPETLRNVYELTTVHEKGGITHFQLKKEFGGDTIIRMLDIGEAVYEGNQKDCIEHAFKIDRTGKIEAAIIESYPVDASSTLEAIVNAKHEGVIEMSYGSTDDGWNKRLRSAECCKYAFTKMELGMRQLRNAPGEEKCTEPETFAAREEMKKEGRNQTASASRA